MGIPLAEFKRATLPSRSLSRCLRVSLLWPLPYVKLHTSVLSFWVILPRETAPGGALRLPRVPVRKKAWDGPYEEHTLLDKLRSGVNPGAVGYEFVVNGSIIYTKQRHL